MPEGTSIAKFYRAIKTRKTDLTKVLDKVFKDPPSLQNTTEDAAIGHPNALLSTDLTNWPTIRKFLEKAIKQHNPIDLGEKPNDIKDKILAHVENWPNSPGGGTVGKEELRQLLSAAINAGSSHKIEFFWELTRDEVPEQIRIHRESNLTTQLPYNTDPDSLNSNEKILVTFVNPWNKVRDELAAAGLIEVDVGPES